MLGSRVAQRRKLENRQDPKLETGSGRKSAGGAYGPTIFDGVYATHGLNRARAWTRPHSTLAVAYIAKSAT